MCCFAVHVKSLDIGEVGKRDSSDREDYYFDCQEPSSDVDKCVRAYMNQPLSRAPDFFCRSFAFPSRLCSFSRLL